MPTAPAPADDLRDLIEDHHREVMAAIRGATDAQGTWHPGLAPQLVALTVRVERLERIVAQITALFLGVATLVAGAWALVWGGPHVPHK